MIKLCLLISTLFLPSFAQADMVTIAAASNVAVPLKIIVSGFEKRTGHEVTLVIGSSGKIFAQLTHGAPYDVFLSADRVKPAALTARGMAATGGPFTYAIGALALWSIRPHLMIDGASILQKGHFNTLAIANPKLAPYGKAAQEVLQSLGLYGALSAKFVTGDNIAQTYQFVATGNADLGFIAVSQLRAAQLQATKSRAPKGSYWIIPDKLHNPIRQDAVLLKSAENNPAAAAFVKFLHSDFAQKTLHDFGYKKPKGAL